MTSTPSPATEARLATIADRFARRADTAGLELELSWPEHDWQWCWHEGEAPRQYFVASITKLFTVAIIMQLRDEGVLALSDTAAGILGAEALAGLQSFGGVDRAAQITVEQLLAHTSGIPDYFEHAPRGATSLIDQLREADRGWTPREALDIARRADARFAPGAPGKAWYSDTNYQLLGLIIESVEGRPYADSVATRVCEPLGLTETYVFTDPADPRAADIAPLLYGRERWEIPRAMASFWADGSVVSTAHEQQLLLRAFWEGELFPREYLAEMTATWRKVFFPLTYGMGVMRYALPRVLSPLRPAPEFLGHSGASGALAYWMPSTGLYVTGTVNQVKHRALSYRLMSSIAAVACPPTR